LYLWRSDIKTARRPLSKLVRIADELYFVCEVRNKD